MRSTDAFALSMVLALFAASCAPRAASSGPQVAPIHERPSIAQEVTFTVDSSRDRPVPRSDTAWIPSSLGGRGSQRRTMGREMVTRVLAYRQERSRAQMQSEYAGMRMASYISAGV